MTNGAVLSGTRITFSVLPAESEHVQDLPPAIPASPTVRERIFEQGRMPRVEDGVLVGPATTTGWAHVSALGLTQADEDHLVRILKLIHDKHKLDKGM